MTDATNEVQITVTKDNTITITCKSHGHPLDEVVKLLFKGLRESGVT